MKHETRAINAKEAAKIEKEYENDERLLLMTGYRDNGRHMTVMALDTFQTIGFNIRGLLDGTNTDSFTVRLATNEEVAGYELGVIPKTMIQTPVDSTTLERRSDILDDLLDWIGEHDNEFILSALRTATLSEKEALDLGFDNEIACQL